MDEVLVFEESVGIDFWLDGGGECSHALSQGGDEGGVGGVCALGVHLLAAAGKCLGALEVETYVVEGGVGVSGSNGLGVIVAP